MTHMARHVLADLCLDTFYYNAHTTAADALWMGVPMVTCLGQTFAGRVAASLLKAVGLTELVTRSAAEYEALALHFAQNPDRLAHIKSKLVRQRDTSPLFDTTAFTRHLEEAYRVMWERWRAGLAAEHLVVGAQERGI